jgi:nucleotide-binding universal stress UspA family protein
VSIKNSKGNIEVREGGYMFEKILVCLDGSDLATQIIPYASETGLRFSSTIILFKVITGHITIPPAGIGYIAPPVRETGPGYSAAVEATRSLAEVELVEIENEEKESLAYLEDIAKELRDKGLNVETVTVHGKADEAIISYAEKNNVNLITIATHGRSGVKRAVLGSVADFVMRNSGLPILLIKPFEKQ